MMGTKTTNFSDQVAASEDEEIIPSVNPVMKVPGSNDGKKRSKEELTWKTMRKSPVDFIRKSSIEEPDVSIRDSVSSSLRKSTSNPLKSIWSTRRTAATATTANQPCIVELRCAKNLPLMGTAEDDGTNPFVTMKVPCNIIISLFNPSENYNVFPSFVFVSIFLILLCRLYQDQEQKVE